MSRAKVPRHLIKMFRLALEAQKRAHAPYSHRYIGAAVLTEEGEIFSGCNVENASFGGTVCAERVAILKAVSETERPQIREILVVSNEREPWPPCGLCRQVIAEFAGPKTLVHIANPHGVFETFRFSDLFPAGFHPWHLKSKRRKS
ncbi:MAG: cytidine deaminase [Bdellovibrionaceae bacterium]|nr:cytidine deaminase [Pseudobdellovibrionaceae bacterium]